MDGDGKSSQWTRAGNGEGSSKTWNANDFRNTGKQKRMHWGNDQDYYEARKKRFASMQSEFTGYEASKSAKRSEQVWGRVRNMLGMFRGRAGMMALGLVGAVAAMSGRFSPAVVGDAAGASAGAGVPTAKLVDAYYNARMGRWEEPLPGMTKDKLVVSKVDSSKVHKRHKDPIVENRRDQRILGMRRQASWYSNSAIKRGRKRR